MGKLNTTPRIVQVDPVLQRELREHATQVNLLSEGRISAVYNATTSAPTTGTWAQGDFVRHSNPTEQNTGGLKYVIYGWECVVAGTPGTWVECRFLTGGGVNITKLLKSTVTLDFPSIAANKVEELTTTITGAATGDFVILAPPSGLEDHLMAMGFVKSANTVAIRMHNDSGASQDPVSASWGITVMTIG